ncbi:AcrR family transcriptional regulator [Dyadobacter jejuensis]|uniref:AcrR family transcriptional regulator n=1 Tax=Dyadobacter jejuensis TaxID=1082580 RepID=A0A316AJS9_9BACT|nr:TetR/AcrR family transcriptional regulator [Dyadobacter jejuensis]PWJ57499.1 AcrR family transcriptional regulator [Dyadobacter jejuensis]
MDQQLKSELTRQLIIDKAFELFYENGFKATSIAGIMEATSLTKGAFYHHFKDKKEIGMEVITQRVQKRIYNWMVGPLSDPKEPKLLLKEIFKNRLASFSLYEKQKGCPANNLINEIGDMETVYQNALRRIIDEWKEALVKLLEKGKKNQCFLTEFDNVAVATYLISSFEGVRGLRKLYLDDAILNDYLVGTNLFIDQL